jgi:hypothetical protein
MLARNSLTPLLVKFPYHHYLVASHTALSYALFMLSLPTVTVFNRSCQFIRPWCRPSCPQRLGSLLHLFVHLLTHAPIRLLGYLQHIARVTYATTQRRLVCFGFGLCLGGFVNTYSKGLLSSHVRAFIHPHIHFVVFHCLSNI